MSLSTATNSTWTALGSPLSACCRPRVWIHETSRASQIRLGGSQEFGRARERRTRGLAGAVEDIRIVTEGTEQTGGQHLAFGFCREAPQVLVVGNREGILCARRGFREDDGIVHVEVAKVHGGREVTLGA